MAGPATRFVSVVCVITYGAVPFICIDKRKIQLKGFSSEILAVFKIIFDQKFVFII